MQARDVMTTPVITAGPDTSVEEIATCLLDNGISAVPVTDANDRLIGIVSEGDLMRRAESGTESRRSWWLELLLESEEKAAAYARTHGRRARDVMTENPVTVTDDTPLPEVARLLERHRIKRLPVMRDGRVVGIVSRANLLHGLAAPRAEEGTAATDRTMRESILKALKEDAGVRTEMINITVSGGVVHLWGAVPSDQELNALRVVVENTAGVRDVENNVKVMAEPIRGV
jgi:CBS domain-containing protein